MSRAVRPDAGGVVEGVEVCAFRVPTDSGESDGTLEWDSTTMVVVEVAGGGERGLGYTCGEQLRAGLDEYRGVERRAPAPDRIAGQAAPRGTPYRLPHHQDSGRDEPSAEGEGQF